MQSYTEENYLKIIFHLSEYSNPVQTNAIAEKIQTKAASVTDMLKKAFKKYKNLDGLLLHSDQGWHYQHTQY